MNLKIQTTSNLRVLEKVVKCRCDRQKETLKRSEKELKAIQKVLERRSDML